MSRTVLCILTLGLHATNAFQAPLRLPAGCRSPELKSIKILSEGSANKASASNGEIFMAYGGIVPYRGGGYGGRYDGNDAFGYGSPHGYGYGYRSQDRFRHAPHGNDFGEGYGSSVGRRTHYGMGGSGGYRSSGYGNVPFRSGYGGMYDGYRSKSSLSRNWADRYESGYGQGGVDGYDGYGMTGIGQRRLSYGMDGYGGYGGYGRSNYGGDGRSMMRGNYGGYGRSNYGGYGRGRYDGYGSGGYGGRRVRYW